MNEPRNVEEPGGIYYVAKNRIQAVDTPIHGWYRFVLGYPPHLVSEYLDILNADPAQDWVFDPFCGTATTPVEARLRGFNTLSADANPISILATNVKLNWDVVCTDIETQLFDIIELASSSSQRFGLELYPAQNIQLSFFNPRISSSKSNGNGLAARFDPESLLPQKAASLIPTGFISPKPLLRVLTLRYAIESLVTARDQLDFLKLALANTIVKTAGNVGFGPEVYRLPPKEDADVYGEFINTVIRMIADLKIILEKHTRPFPDAFIFTNDARILSQLKNYPPISVVITSPPYPNEKDYTRSTRLESILLGLIADKEDLRKLKSNLLRSNTRNVFVNDDDDIYVQDIPSIKHVADKIEDTRIKLGKTSGFERLYHRVTRLYFGGMYRHFMAMRPYLHPDARCAYVVGDQMSFFREHIRTAHLLADVAIKAGYRVEGIQLWRTRRSTVTGLELKENVLILRR